MARESKKLNLVIVGLKEPGGHGVRHEEDKVFILDACDMCGVDWSDVYDDVFRDGVQRELIGGRAFSRIIKIKFSNSAAKMKFLRNIRRTRRDATSRVYVRHDLTVRQREHDKHLRSELYRRRQESPNEDLIIRNGEIIVRKVRQQYA